MSDTLVSTAVVNSASDLPVFSMDVGGETLDAAVFYGAASPADRGASCAVVTPEITPRLET